MSYGHTAQTYTRYIADNMHISHRSNAAAHTPCACDTPMCVVLLWLVEFVGVFHRLPDFYACVCTQADVYIPVHFVVVARSTDHRADNNNNSPQSVLTSSFLQHHSPAAQQQQQQWAHLARIDDRTVHIAVCDPTLPLLLWSSAQQCANSSSRQGTMRMWKIRAVRSGLLL